MDLSEQADLYSITLLACEMTVRGDMCLSEVTDQSTIVASLLGSRSVYPKERYLITPNPDRSVAHAALNIASLSTGQKRNQLCLPQTSEVAS